MNLSWVLTADVYHHSHYADRASSSDELFRFRELPRKFALVRSMKSVIIRKERMATERDASCGSSDVAALCKE